MLDQAESLRRLVQGEEKLHKEKYTKIITITSGKGGVGKSNFVVNLALSLRKEGKKVLIFDADVGMGNDDVLMGIYPKNNVVDLIKGKCKIQDVITEGPLGIKLLPGGSGLVNIEDFTQDERDKFLREIEALEGYDYILIDTGAGINRSVLAFIAASEELILVTTPEPTSLTDGYSLLKAVNHFSIKKEAKVIVNRVFSESEGIHTYNKFNKVVEKFLDINTNYLGHILDDRKITMAVREQRPIVLSYPAADASKSIVDITNRILGENKKNENLNVKKLFKRLFNIFS